jgi:predicted nucleic acid-binding protein
MNDKAFFDTNILVYSFASKPGQAAEARRDRAQQLVILGGVVSIQVLNEFVQVCRRKMALDWDRIVASLEVIKELCGPITAINLETHEAALKICRRYQFQIYDALIVAAASQAGCATLYTEDMQHGQTIGGVRIVNPFE